MKTRISFLVLVLLLAAAALASAQEILYTGAVTKDMTIRERKSTSAKKLGSVEAGEFVSIIEFGETWTMIEKDGTTGYILSKNVDDLAAAAGYNDAADALYLGVAGKELTIRAKKSKSAQRLLPGDVVEVPANVKHWHGAAADSWFSHLAFEYPGEDASNEWLEPVDDGAYYALS